MLKCFSRTNLSPQNTIFVLCNILILIRALKVLQFSEKMKWKGVRRKIEFYKTGFIYLILYVLCIWLESMTNCGFLIAVCKCICRKLFTTRFKLFGLFSSVWFYESNNNFFPSNRRGDCFRAVVISIHIVHNIEINSWTISDLLKCNNIVRIQNTLFFSINKWKNFILISVKITVD